MNIFCRLITILKVIILATLMTQPTFSQENSTDTVARDKKLLEELYEEMSSKNSYYKFHSSMLYSFAGLHTTMDNELKNDGAISFLGDYNCNALITPSLYMSVHIDIYSQIKLSPPVSDLKENYPQLAELMDDYIMQEGLTNEKLNLEYDRLIVMHEKYPDIFQFNHLHEKDPFSSRDNQCNLDLLNQSDTFPADLRQNKLSLENIIMMLNAHVKELEHLMEAIKVNLEKN
ncbi:hypothetical protein [Pseudemcibacter aquimaris]|uniref:hypothetical protein n=1 Tax=Pseudemcibacter aquimaris TaxID=2857064 RepID=UPI0020113673|nr:hypothetical protein [Pseudemcibacter aquimaris]MCC3862655.1 hypothetical protein [Pseudemcibacter aquimaris]WDU57754.1 hypothetical protein KW060_11155 [Pseudemcibacter aquimaris]